MVYIRAALSELGMQEPTTQPALIFQSWINFDSEGDLNKSLGVQSELSKAMADALDTKFQMELHNIEFSVDQNSTSGGRSKVFRIERRGNEPYDLNRWHSFANATTKKHGRFWN
jgi:hypothetical protein